MKVEQYLKSIRKMSSRVIISLKHRPEGLQLNGAHIRTIDRIHAGDTLSVTMEDTPPDYLESEIRVPILYEDEDVLVYNKPVDMPCHQAKTHQQDTLANVFARDCRERGLTLSYRQSLAKTSPGGPLVGFGLVAGRPPAYCRPSTSSSS